MRLPRAPHPRVTCARNIKISDKTRDCSRQLMCKDPSGYEAGPYNSRAGSKGRQETALKLPFVTEQHSLTKSFLRRCFWKWNRVLREGEVGIFASQATPSPCFILPQASVCPPDSTTPKKSPRTISFCGRPGPDWRKQISLFKISHRGTANLLIGKYIICPTARSP